MTETVDHTKYEYRITLYQDGVAVRNVPAGSRPEYVESTQKLCSEAFPDMEQRLLRRPWVSLTASWGEWSDADDSRA